MLQGKFHEEIGFPPLPLFWILFLFWIPFLRLLDSLPPSYGFPSPYFHPALVFGVMAGQHRERTTYRLDLEEGAGVEAGGDLGLSQRAGLIRQLEAQRTHSERRFELQDRKPRVIRERTRGCATDFWPHSLVQFHWYRMVKFSRVGCYPHQEEEDLPERGYRTDRL